MKNTLALLLLIPLSGFAAEFDKKYIGVYSWGPEVDVFSPCNGTTTYWASYNWAALEMLEFYKGYVKKKAYQPMYIEFRGHMLDEEVDGFAGAYDGLIHISEVYSFSFKIPSNCN